MLPRCLAVGITGANAGYLRNLADLAVASHDRVGVHIGSGIGGFDVIEREHSAMLAGGPRKISPFFIPGSIVNLAAGHVSIRYGARGPNEATATACIIQSFLETQISSSFGIARSSLYMAASGTAITAEMGESSPIRNPGIGDRSLSATVIGTRRISRN